MRKLLADSLCVQCFQDDQRVVYIYINILVYVHEYKSMDFCVEQDF